MHYPQLVICEQDELLARRLRGLAEERQWFVRTPRQTDACLRLLASGHPCVVVLRVGRDLGREMTLLERICWTCPHVPVVVVGEVENPALSGLAWHLGAACVLLPPQPRDLLPSVVIGLMETACQGFTQPAGKNEDDAKENSDSSGAKPDE